MDTKQEVSLTIEEAIKISKLICSVSEERIPMVLDILSKAGVSINGLDELEEWKALKDQAYIVDMDEFVSELTKYSKPDAKEIRFRPEEFAKICKQFNVKPSCAKRALYKKGIIKTTEFHGKIDYTIPVWEAGKAVRYVVILKGVQHG